MTIEELIELRKDVEITILDTIRKEIARFPKGVEVEDLRFLMARFHNDLGGKRLVVTDVEVKLELTAQNEP